MTCKLDARNYLWYLDDTTKITCCGQFTVVIISPWWVPSSRESVDQDVSETGSGNITQSSGRPFNKRKDVLPYDPVKFRNREIRV